MAIPDFQSLMLPLLKLTSDGKIHSLKGAREVLSQNLGLTPDELAQRLSNSGQFVFGNRVSWAKVYLQDAGLLASPERGSFAITEDGRRALAMNPSRIDIKFLTQFPKFRAHNKAQLGVPKDSDSKPDNTEEKVTPEEIIEDAYARIQKDLSEQLLVKIRENEPSFFEGLVVQLIQKMGYGMKGEEPVEITGRPGDEGIDGIVRQDPLGVETIYLQAKRWKDSVGRPQIQEFVGALHGKHAKKGIFITTGHFTNDALNYVKSLELKVILIDGLELAKHMTKLNVGVKPYATYELKQIDYDYFDE